MPTPDIPFDPPLVKGTLLKRYKRFLADVRLDDGREIVAHCMNTGSMSGLTEPGSRIWLTPHDNPKRKLQWTWQIASDGDVSVGINTSLPNKLVALSIEEQAIPELTGYSSIRREVPYGEGSRIDVYLEGHPQDKRPCYVEVKSVTLGAGEFARFPDAVTKRGQKHLKELSLMVAEGHRAVAFFLIQRGDAKRFGPAWTVDPVYAQGLVDARNAGVEVLAWTATVSPGSVGLGRPLDVDLTPEP